MVILADYAVWLIQVDPVETVAILCRYLVKCRSADLVKSSNKRRSVYTNLSSLIRR